MSEYDLFYDLRDFLRRPEFRVNPAPTMGGIWGVETFRHGTLTYQLMDDGATQRIYCESFDLYDTYKGFEYKLGSSAELKSVWNQFAVRFPKYFS